MLAAVWQCAEPRRSPERSAVPLIGSLAVLRFAVEAPADGTARLPGDFAPDNRLTLDHSTLPFSPGRNFALP